MVDEDQLVELVGKGLEFAHGLAGEKVLGLWIDNNHSLNPLDSNLIHRR